MKRELKDIKIAMFAVLILTIIMCLIIWYDASKIRIINIEDYESADIKVSMEETVVNAGVLKIKGWAADIGTTSVLFDTEVVLLDTSSSIGMVLPTNMEYRHDVTEVYDDGNEYDCSGFISYVEADSVNLYEKNYEVCVIYDGKLVHTDCYIVEGEKVEK